MNKLLNNFAALTMSALASGTAMQASAWTTNINCEGTATTKVLQGLTNTFTNTFNKTLYSTTQVLSGNQSCQMGIDKGTDGWGNWGAIYSFPSKLSAGSQLWIRVNVFVPTGFNYTGNPWLKFMRVHTASPAASNQGYLDLYINPPTGTVWDATLNKETSTPFTFYYEGKPQVRTLGTRATDAIALGKWESYEIHYKLDTKSKDAGGTGEIRVWKNNKLLADLTDQVTLADANTYAESFFLFTYWNGNAPATQSLYVDDVAMTTDTPSNRDSNGYPFIGGSVASGSPATSTAAPTAPSNIKVTQ